MPHMLVFSHLIKKYIITSTRNKLDAIIYSIKLLSFELVFKVGNPHKFQQFKSIKTEFSIQLLLKITQSSYSTWEIITQKFTSQSYIH